MWSLRMGWYWVPLICLWNQDWGSPLYEISRAAAPLRISGRSDMVSLTVMVRYTPPLPLRERERQRLGSVEKMRLG